MRPAAPCLALAAPLLASAAPIEPAELAPAGLCGPREAAIFACDISDRSVAVCVGEDGHAQYRAGRPGRVELASPPRGEGLSYASRGYSGGGESQVRFTRGAYAYVVYSGVYRTAFGPDGRHDPAFVSGLVVTRGGRTIMQRKCIRPADAVLDLPAAQKRMPEAEFLEHD
jgi:hypothetical protein